MFSALKNSDLYRVQIAVFVLSVFYSIGYAAVKSPGTASRVIVREKSPAAYITNHMVWEKTGFGGKRRDAMRIKGFG